MFSNVKGSADWEEFLGVLGAKVELQGWPNYRAGLDVKTGTTGIFLCGFACLEGINLNRKAPTLSIPSIKIMR